MFVFSQKISTVIFDPWTAMSDQDRSSPYNFVIKSSRQGMRIAKISIRGLLPNSPT